MEGTGKVGATGASQAYGAAETGDVTSDITSPTKGAAVATMLPGFSPDLAGGK